MTSNDLDGFGEMVRDFTAHNGMAKSEARRRFHEIIARAEEAARKEEKTKKESKGH